MFSGLNVFKMADALTAYAEQRQAVVARNVANSDTPGYRAQDIVPFEQLFQRTGGPGGMRASRGGHVKEPLKNLGMLA
jgi:flagellar basal-body rod protein FlgB